MVSEREVRIEGYKARFEKLADGFANDVFTLVEELSSDDELTLGDRIDFVVFMEKCEKRVQGILSGRLNEGKFDGKE